MPELGVMLSGQFKFSSFKEIELPELEVMLSDQFKCPPLKEIELQELEVGGPEVQIQTFMFLFMESLVFFIR